MRKENDRFLVAVVSACFVVGMTTLGISAARMSKSGASHAHDGKGEKDLFGHEVTPCVKCDG